MIAAVAAALVLSIECQSAVSDRSRAEQLARAGHTAEALALFEHIVVENPADIDARLWVARLDLRMGRTAKAEAGFRSVIREHPADVDARIGLGGTLIRKGEWQEALAILTEAERDAGENADLYAALARAYRRAGDDRRALDYFRRAKALSPGDPDVVLGFEATVRTYGHSIAVEGYGEHTAPSSNAGSGSIELVLRATPRLRVEARGRVLQRSGSTDVSAGGGVEWRVDRATTVYLRASGGPGNTSLPTAHVSGDLVHYAGVFEVGGGIRVLSYTGVNVVAASPTVAWDPGGRWRLDTRYTYSHSAFAATGRSSGDHSVQLRETWRGWRRVSLNAAYDYGIESFEDLTADRLRALGSNTMAGGVRIDTPSLAQVFATWEHQWRSNDTIMDRLTLSIVRSFP